MNTTPRRSALGIAFAGLVLAATAACGSGTDVAPAKISDPIPKTSPAPGPAEACPGKAFYSADQWARTVGSCTKHPANPDEIRAAESRKDDQGRIPDYRP